MRTNGTATPGFAPDGTLVFNSTDETQNLFFFNDLFALPPGTKSPSGLDGRRVRLTDGFRALDPDVSPDGRHVVFTTNHRGTQYLQIADFHGTSIDNVHALVKSGEFEQAYTPRFSPDGSHVAYSIWKKGGYRDIRLVDVSDGSFVEHHPRPRHRRRPLVLEGRALAPLPLRSHRRLEHLRLRARDRRAEASDERDQRRVPAASSRPTARRSSTRDTPTPAGTCTRCASIRRSSSTRSPTKTIAPRPLPIRCTTTGSSSRTTLFTRSFPRAFSASLARETSGSSRRSRPAAATSPASTATASPTATSYRSPISRGASRTRTTASR